MARGQRGNRASPAPPAMAPPPLPWLLRLAALCHLTALLAGEWGGLLQQLGRGAPAPLLPFRPDMGGSPPLGKVHSSPFQRWGTGSSLTPDSGLPLPLEDCPSPEPGRLAQ